MIIYCEGDIVQLAQGYVLQSIPVGDDGEPVREEIVFPFGTKFKIITQLGETLFLECYDCPERSHISIHTSGVI